jgi:penicillin amidase
LDAFRGFLRAYDVESFRDAVQFFDVGSQNFGYADVDGDIAYFTSAEMPLREDLQNLNAPDGGVPPFLIRDGSGQLRHEWLPLPLPPGAGTQSLPYEILPFAEMPQVVNPESGYIVNANNDPVGTTLDNNPLNQLRPGGGLYYLSPGYASGFRAGRIQRVIEQHLSSGDGQLSVDELRTLQANNQLLDAEVLTPYITQAFDNATAPGASALLDVFGSDPEVAEAVGRLAAWDFSTPTGIPEGYDPGDDPGDLPAPSQGEIDASVAATIYSAWRGQIVQQVIDRTLDGVGVGDFAPGSSTAVAALRHHLDTFPTNQGMGASGLDFFAFPGAATREEARDLVILECLRSALDLLASDTFAPAFGNSTDQDDYRWGRLHRIVFDHVLGGPFNIPPAGGFSSLAADLPGISRAGGFGAVDASSHSARADGLNEFMFGSGPARRFVGVMTPSGPDPQEVIPGGQVGIVGHPDYASQLPLWLTNAYHPFQYRPGEVVRGTERFRLFLPEQ